MESVRSPWKFVVWASLSVICAIGVCSGVAYWWHANWETARDFSALWNTTDAIEHYIEEHQQWPSNWQSLQPSVAATNGPNDISFLRQRIEVNFQVGQTRAPLNGDWYVRVKSGRISKEQSTANDRLGRNVRVLSSQHSLETP